MQSEIKRKLFHLLGGVYLLVYAELPRRPALVYLAGLGILITMGEAFRLWHPRVNAWMMRLAGSITRADEVRHFSGVFWTWLGCWLTMALFVQPRIVLPAIGFLVFGDAAAALVGRAIGKHPWPGHPRKSFEGSAAFALVSLVCGLYYLPFWIVFPSALLSAYVESRRVIWNDNFWIPLVSASCLLFFLQLVAHVRR